jgi:hypothetical protein
MSDQSSAPGTGLQSAMGHGPAVPAHRKCGALEAHHALLERFPDSRKSLADLERLTLSRFAQRTAFRAAAGPIRIPVVVHVVWNTPSEKISEAQVQSQIVALNRDYSATNEDKAKAPACWRGLLTATDIQFALASTDPAGQATNGITYTQTTQTAFDVKDGVKSTATGGADPWPSDKYLNLWVCTLSDGLLGYAQFPGMPAATDGVVILSSAFGTTGTATAPFNLGRTATHEVGHWLNLHHIWGDTQDCTGSDFVDDTPPQQLPNYGTPTFPHVSCTNGPNGDMFMNFMDYVDDACMVMFTAGQVVRMHAAIDGARASFATAGA